MIISNLKSQISNLLKNKVLLLVLILLIAAVLRLYNLASVPPSPDWDEAALGYNAYSILHTGRDEYGKFLPVILRSFDDYKPALYSYLIIPVIYFSGLSLWAVRFPSAITGIFSVLGTFILVRQLFKNDKLALLASFMLAISPWHIQFSHIAFEASVGIFFNIYAAIFFLKGLKKPLFLFPAILFSISSIYTYQSEKVFAPLFFLSLIIIFRKEIFKISKKYLVTGFIFGIILLLPLVSYTLSNKAVFARAQGVSFLSNTDSILKTDVQRLIFDKASNDIIGEIYDNRRLVFLKQATANYLTHFDFNWLFLLGDLPRHHAPGMGLLYLWEIPFVLIGVYQLLFGKYDNKLKLFVFTWLLIVPIPASVTTGVPHAIRTLNFLPLFQIFTALGLLVSFQKISSIKYSLLRVNIKYVLFALCSLLFAFNFFYYLDQYFVQQNYFNSYEWQYGYAPAVNLVQKVQKNYKKIIVADNDYFTQSYMFFLFYLKYPPLEYQHFSQNASGGFKENHAFGKYEFRPINWSTEKKSSSILYIGRPTDFPPGVNIIETIHYLDGKPAIAIVEG